ncbi:FAD-dependent oxidoreductase [Chloroflexus sp. MS-CIW-1]|uniref:NAD(P)/FAD-dependent oxidoreductase n=1 Tax=Chloroflexus sp. MS-CIW-1 TaxID=3055768 RepID=UPI002649833F|nr:FAD-dependent oxidoreductase [Chloroflexus sp. MS-CIW-1]MDN5272989.1 FAD-dependent oxidoreductase [Chloroflexus sp. MS-CIW-1]
MVKRVAIVGAGVAGLAAARSLVDAHTDIVPVVFEKSRGVGGRAATRRIGDFCFDHGAQYVKVPTPAIRDLIVATGDAVTIDRPVWTFTRSNTIAPGDVALADEQKWTWPTGITRLAKYLASGIDVRIETTVASLNREGDAYRLFADDGQVLGNFAAVVLTAPAPQSAAILMAGNFSEANDLVEALQAVQYRRSISITVAFPQRPVVPWYALVNVDRQHTISWLACEHDKPNRAPPDHGLLIAQMSDAWATAHWDELQKGTYTLSDAPSPVIEALADIESLIGDLGAPYWINVQRWRYALPDTATPLRSYERIVLAGDLTGGQGRVHLAIESGWQAANQIRALLL